jgi:hypothetical protein
MFLQCDGHSSRMNNVIKLELYARDQTTRLIGSKGEFE